MWKDAFCTVTIWPMFGSDSVSDEYTYSRTGLLAHRGYMVTEIEFVVYCHAQEFSVFYVLMSVACSPKKFVKFESLNDWKCIRHFENVTFLYVFRLLEWVRSWRQSKVWLELPKSGGGGGANPPPPPSSSPCAAPALTVARPIIFPRYLQSNQSEMPTFNVRHHRSMFAWDPFQISVLGIKFVWFVLWSRRVIDTIKYCLPFAGDPFVSVLLGNRW